MAKNIDNPAWLNTGREYTRSRVRERDNHTCQDCQKVWVNDGRKRFDVHHLNGLCGKRSRRYDPISTMDQLITLCHKCHYGRHDFSKKGKLSISGQNRKDKKRGPYKKH